MANYYGNKCLQGDFMITANVEGVAEVGVFGKLQLHLFSVAN